MEFRTIEASPRGVGKKAVRQIRREGNVPCVLYGHNVEPQTFSMPAFGLFQLVRSEETHLVKIDLGGKSWECILKEIIYHPVSDEPIHADFQVLQRGEKITVQVPIRFIGTPKGQMDGGVTQHVLNELEISCLPKDIPGHIDIDVAGLTMGQSIHIRDLNVENIEFVGVPSQTIIAILAPRVATDAGEGEAAPAAEADAE
ncbi:MAG: 50S ribosomal protein L25 [Rhodothermales bacterium]